MFNPEFSNAPDLRTNGVRDIPLAEIDIPDDRARSYDEDEARALASIIAATGLQHPIRVRVVGNRFRLIAGRKRLEAFRMLQWEAIPSTISTASTDDGARLEEVMENLGRVELNKLDRCQHLYELKQVHERLYPEARNGGDRKSEKIRIPNWDSDPGASEVFGFVEVAAQKIGLSRTRIADAVKIWMDLTPESRERASGTRLANHQSGLKELSEQSPADQVKVLDMVLAEPPVASTVADAVEMLKTGIAKTAVERKAEVARKALEALPQPVASSIASAQSDAARLAELQKGIATLSKFFGDLKDDELDTVIQQHEERVIASLKRRGRI
ncbi:ParB N-terminal domain-containing protein [Shinella sp. HZN7]|uniref:ParB/RepB/Spo0J family partition protein n=1 Tax=Shinella sp. (strain HZN7) TaxID=879274 RepID=UPI0007DA78B4|nr:ParB N-terminal domain-containing protein [Shinella sp. HZN7]ANH05014.1 chromosome partitioning protein ParB [Shinella sp. HZN7]